MERQSSETMAGPGWDQGGFGWQSKWKLRFKIGFICLRHNGPNINDETGIYQAHNSNLKQFFLTDSWSCTPVTESQ